MSASICSSSRRMPVRFTRSSTDAKRLGRFAEFEEFAGFGGLAGPVLQSCEHVLQKYTPARTTSIIDSSSHPHLGQYTGIRDWGFGIGSVLSLPALSIE